MVQLVDNKKVMEQNDTKNHSNEHTMHKKKDKNTVSSRIKGAIKFVLYIILVSVTLGIFFAYLFIKFGNKVVYNVKNTVLHEKQVVNNYFDRLKNFKLFGWLNHKHNEETTVQIPAYGKKLGGQENIESNSNQAFNN